MMMPDLQTSDASTDQNKSKRKLLLESAIRSGLTYNEFNTLYESENKLRSMPFERYFGEMDISQEQKDRRIQTAEDIHAFMVVALMEQYYQHQLPFDELNKLNPPRQILTTFDTSDMSRTITEGYRAVLEEQDAPHTPLFLATHMDLIIAGIVAATIANADDPYFYSDDRATMIAENESNSIWNNSEYADATQAGHRWKTWRAIMDKRTRATHVEANGTRILIDQPFSVGDSLLMYPKDESLGASPEEIVNCRCSVTYS